LKVQKINWVSMLGIATIATGCATQGKSVGMGAGIGAGVGAIAGGLADPGKDGQYRTRNVLIGGAVGGATGVLAGALIHDATEEKAKASRKEGELVGRLDAPVAGQQPNLKDPRVEAHWIEPRVAGNRYIDGHFEYVIIDPARWESN
jgi:hypothetical protein